MAYITLDTLCAVFFYILIFAVLIKYIPPTFHSRCQPSYKISSKYLNPRLNYNNFFEIQDGSQPLSWISENLISDHWVSRAADFPSRYQIWCKNVDRRRNYGPKSKSKMAAVRHLGFRKSDVLVLSIGVCGVGFSTPSLVTISVSYRVIILYIPVRPAASRERGSLWSLCSQQFVNMLIN